jgi:hypothetical protein
MPKASSNGHTNGNGNGKLHWQFTGSLDTYLADWSWPHLAAMVEPRQSHQDPMEPHLGNIARRLQAFHDDPANKVEVLDPNDEQDREKLAAHHERAQKKFHAWNNEVYDRAKEGRSDGGEDHITQGLDYMNTALESHESIPKSELPHHRVAVATHKGDVVGAQAFSKMPEGHLWVHMLGTDQGTYGTGTALQHAMARYGSDVEANGIEGSHTHSSEKYHQSIGRVLSGAGAQRKSRWSKDDMEQVASVPTYIQQSRVATLAL